MYVVPVLYALFVWWLSTALIIFLDNLPRATHPWSLTAATGVLVAALFGLHVTAADASVTGAYLAFTCGVLAWGWQEMSFFTGFITGPTPEPCPEGCSGWRRFTAAVQATLYHELAILVTAVIIVATTQGGVNQVGVWTYMALWLMRQSAKFNVFFGVRNLSPEFVPAHLAFIGSYMKQRPMNFLFPFSVSAMLVAAVLLIQRAGDAASDPFGATFFVFIATMVVLGLIEHWFLVVPLNFAALWSWCLRKRAVVRRVHRPPIPFTLPPRLAPIAVPVAPTRTVGGTQ